jgi:hypothetical protein
MFQDAVSVPLTRGSSVVTVQMKVPSRTCCVPSGSVVQSRSALQLAAPSTTVTGPGVAAGLAVVGAPPVGDAPCASAGNPPSARHMPMAAPVVHILRMV